jgi:hypothetical protein
MQIRIFVCLENIETKGYFITLEEELPLDSLITILLIIFWLGILPLFLGNRLVKEEITFKDIFLSYIFGWMKMFAWFQVLAIPFIFLRFRLTTLVIVWAVGVILLLIYYLTRNYKGYIKILKEKLKIPRPRYLEVLAVLLIVFQLVAVTYLTHEDADDAFFIGQAVTDFHTDTMLIYVGDTGSEWGNFPPRYVFSPFPTFLAAMSRLIMIHPLTLARVFFQIIFIVMSYMVYYLLAHKVFGEDRNKVALTMCFISLLNMWGNISVFTSSSFLLFRLHQGKALLANLILPFLIYLVVSYYKEKKFNQKELLLVTISSTLVSGMGVFLAPLLLGLYALVRFVRERKVLIIGQTILCSMPNIAIGIAFLILR